jgi:hypothetical protein
MTNVRITKAQLRRMIREEFKRASGETNSRQQLNEGILDMLGSLFSSLGGGLSDQLKGSICRMLLGIFGVDRNNVFGQTVCNTFEALSMEEITRLISGDEGMCQTLAENITEGFAETLIEQLGDAVFGPAGGFFGGAFREMISNAILNNQEFTSRIAEALCRIPGQVGSLLSDAGVSDEAAAPIKAAVEQAGGASTTTTVAESRRQRYRHRRSY